MEIEIGDNVTITSIVLFVVLGIVTLGVHGCRQDEETDREAYRNGYEQYMEPWSKTPLWKKAEKHEN